MHEAQEHEALWHKDQPCTVGGRGRGSDGTGRSPGHSCSLSLAVMEIITVVQSTGKVRKGRGRRVLAEVPAQAFPELCRKNSKGLDCLEEQV